ncbi:hypothetical protein AAG570_009339 [Ranatra chinensis]|uniref:Uncharacterized protein n=1 Tax=Ranatra chinensis TaxID=642074 RepID=A0ABD0YNT4_9HEMI
MMKVETPEFKSVLTPQLRELLSIFKKHNYEIRIAGGAVRDILLNITPKDVDFATTATPDQMKSMFTSEGVRMINTKGEKHGTITARIDGFNFEDLTINSMFLGEDGTVYDYFGGYEDLRKRRVIFVGNARSRIKEDYLRILRYFRFYARIALSPDDHDSYIIEAITENVDGLGKITGERIWMELSKILSGNYVKHIMQRLISVGAGPYIGLPPSPDIDEMKTVWERGKTFNLHPITILVSLMKDTNEVLLFHARCKLSAFERDLGLFIVEHRQDPTTPHPLKPYQALMFKTDGKLSDIRTYILELFKYKGNLVLMDEFQKWQPPRFPINGHILKDRGVPKGKQFGLVMNKCKEYWIDNDFAPTEKDILSKLPTIIENLGIRVNESNSSNN